MKNWQDKVNRLISVKKTALERATVKRAALAKRLFGARRNRAKRVLAGMDECDWRSVSTKRGSRARN